MTDDEKTKMIRHLGTLAADGDMTDHKFVIITVLLALLDTTA